MGRRLTQQELDGFLRQPYLARLATIQEDGSPYIVPVWHEYDGEALYIVAREKSQYVAHIQHEPRVALSIVEGAQVLIQGTLDRPRYLIRVTLDKVVSWTGEGWHPRYLNEHSTTNDKPATEGGAA
jgi:hypothetical protein